MGPGIPPTFHMNPKGISSNKDKHSNNSSSGSRNSSGINCVDEGATVQAGGPLPRGPSGPLKLECISISSDSEDGGGNTTLSPRRVLFPSESIICSSNNKASSSSIERKSSNGGAKDPPVLLIDSEDDSDYKRDVLAVIDSDEEPVNSPSISRAEPLAGRALSAVLPSGDAVQGDSCEFDFPCIYALFAEYNDRFFGGRLAHVEVKWSTKMTLCAGLCVYKTGGYCSVRLSEPLLRLRSIKELKETLLHEMIHAFLFVTEKNRSHSAHGPLFLDHMKRLNEKTGLNITVYHNFHDEVNHYRRHIWRCEGPCRERPPYFGFVRRAMNRPPGPHDWWYYIRLSGTSASHTAPVPAGNLCSPDMHSWSGGPGTYGGVIYAFTCRAAAASPRENGLQSLPKATSSTTSSTTIESYYSNANRSSSSSSSTRNNMAIKSSAAEGSASSVGKSSNQDGHKPRQTTKAVTSRDSLTAAVGPEDPKEEALMPTANVNYQVTSAVASGRIDAITVVAFAARGRSAARTEAAEQRAAAAEKRAVEAAKAAAAGPAGDESAQKQCPSGAQRRPSAPDSSAAAPCPRCHRLVAAATLHRHIQCCIRDNPLSSAVKGGDS